MTFRSLTIFLFASGWIIASSCSKEKPTATGIDAQMYAIAQNLSGFSWYKNSDTLLTTSSGSGHNFSFLRTRYNVAAASRLDANGMVVNGAVFPEGSMVVKELYDNDKVFKRYAILYKQSGNENADANGWIWGYINSDKTVADLASNKGSSCISCHTQSDNIDYMLMNKYFP